jgi:serine/threonine protein kinase
MVSERIQRRINALLDEADQAVGLSDWSRVLDRDIAFALIPGDALDPAGRERVLREARAMARLGDHPNLVSIHDIGKDGQDIYTVQEFMAGGDAGTRLQSTGVHDNQPDWIAEVIHTASDVCRALDAIHAAGVTG